MKIHNMCILGKKEVWENNNLSSTMNSLQKTNIVLQSIGFKSGVYC